MGQKLAPQIAHWKSKDNGTTLHPSLPHGRDISVHYLSQQSEPICLKKGVLPPSCTRYANYASSFWSFCVMRQKLALQEHIGSSGNAMNYWECWTLSPFSILACSGRSRSLSTELFWLRRGPEAGKINLISYPFQCNRSYSCARLGYHNFLIGILISHKHILLLIFLLNLCCCGRTKAKTSYSSILLTSPWHWNLHQYITTLLENVNQLQWIEYVFWRAESHLLRLFRILCHVVASPGFKLECIYCFV